MITDAKALAARKLAVFPCWPRDKRPATARGCHDATTDPAVIERWWRRDPNYNVAIATGPVSGIFALDIDGVDAEAELRRLEAMHGNLPSTVESITGRGRHIFFQCPSQPVRNSAGRIAPGVDVRALGGYVLAPPSVHPSGRRYCWSVDSASSFAPAPEWLLDAVTDRKAAAADKHPVTPASDWRALVRDGVEEGQRNAAAARLAGHLLRRWVDPVVVLELLLAWNARCRPPLDDGEVASIVDSIAGRELKRRGCGD